MCEKARRLEAALSKTPETDFVFLFLFYESYMKHTKITLKSPTKRHIALQKMWADFTANLLLCRWIIMLQQMDSLSISRPGSSYVTHTGHNSPPDTFQTDFTLKKQKKQQKYFISTCYTNMSCFLYLSKMYLTEDQAHRDNKCWSSPLNHFLFGFPAWGCQLFSFCDNSLKPCVVILTNPLTC